MHPPSKLALVVALAIVPLALGLLALRQGGDGRVYRTAEVRQLALRQPGGWDGKVLRVRARLDYVSYYMAVRGPVDVLLYGPGWGCPFDGPVACLPSGPVQAGTVHLSLDARRVPGTAISVLYEPCPARAGPCTAWPPPEDRLRALLRRVPLIGRLFPGPSPVGVPVPYLSPDVGVDAVYRLRFLRNPVRPCRADPCDAAVVLAVEPGGPGGR